MTVKKKTGRGAPAGPPVRGRRGHKTVDLYPDFRVFLKDLLLHRPKLTLDEILEKLKGTGYRISRSALARFGQEFEIERARRELVTEMAREYAKDDDGSILDVETAIANFANTKILQQLFEGAGSDLDGKSVELLDLFQRLQTSSSTRERAKLAHNRGVKKAIAQTRETMFRILKSDPDALRRVLRALEQAATEAKQ